MVSRSPRSERHLRRRVAVITAGLLTLSLLTAGTSAEAATCPTVAVDGTVTPAAANLVDWSGCDLHGAHLAGTFLQTANLAGANLTGADLRATRLEGARLAGAILDGANLSTASVSFADLTGASFTGTTAGFVTWNSAVLTDAKLGGVTILDGASGRIRGIPASLPATWQLQRGVLVGPRARIVDADLSGLDLTGANLAHATLRVVDLTGSNLSGVDLTGAVLNGVAVQGAVLATTTVTSVQGTLITGIPASFPASWAIRSGRLLGPTAVQRITAVVGEDWSGLDLSSIDLTSSRLTRVNLAGSSLSAATLSRLYTHDLTGLPSALPAAWSTTVDALVGPTANLVDEGVDGLDLHGRDLHQITLHSATSANLSGANLQGAGLGNGSLVFANLAGADLSGATLTGATANGAALTGANLTGAFLFATSLIGADLKAAVLNGANVVGAVFTNADLTGATGLTTAYEPTATWTGATCPDATPAATHNHGACTAALDTTAPSIVVGQLPRFITPPYVGDAPFVDFPRTMTDGAAGSGVTRIRIQQRTTGAGGRDVWSPITTSGWIEDPTAPIRVSEFPDQTTCERAQVGDAAGNVSAWSAWRCTTTGFDDFPAGGWTTWTQRVAHGWFEGTYSSTTVRGRFLRTVEDRKVRLVGVVATTCPTCGTVALYVGSTRVGTLSLARSTTTLRRTLLLPRLHALLHGRVTIKVVSSGRLVRVDALLTAPF